MWFVGIVLAALVGAAVYALGFGAEVAYIARSAVRYLVAHS